MSAPESREGTRWPLVGLALLLAGIVAWLAPASWPAGPATLRVSTGDGSSIERPVRFGSPEPVLWEIDEGALQGLRIHIPAGLALNAPLAVEVEQAGLDGVDAIRLEIELSDGRREPVPFLGTAEGADRGAFGRRPPVGSHIVLALVALVVVLWVTSAVPLWVTALLVPVIVATSGLLPARTALAPFFHPIIALFFGGFLMAEAMKRVGLDHRLATAIVARTARSPAWLFLSLLGLSAFLSMWMSNTASTALLIPIALAVTEPLNAPGYRRAVVLGLAYAGTIGGIGSAIGTPANLLAIEFLGSYVGHEITFAGWFAIGLPVLVVMLPVVAAYVWWRLGVEVEGAAFTEARRVAGERLSDIGRPSRSQVGVAAVFVIIVAMWMTQRWHGVHPGVVALGGAALLALLGYVRNADLGRISWEALLTFGGGLALGSVMVESGTSDWLATRLVGLEAAPQLIGVLVIAVFALVLTATASNTASAAILIPLSIPLASTLGLDPTTLVLIVAVATSIDFALVIGTPPTMLAYATGLFTTARIFRIGIVLDLVCLVLLVTAVRWIWSALGVAA